MYDVCVYWELGLITIITNMLLILYIVLVVWWPLTMQYFMFDLCILFVGMVCIF